MFLKRIFKQIDLTEGKPWKVLFLFAIPLLLTNLLNNAFSLVNSLVLKTTVGGNAVTAIGSTGPISSILFNFAYGCSTGFGVIMATRFGAKDENRMKKTFYTSMVLAIGIGLLITIIGLCSYKGMLSFLNVANIYREGAERYILTLLIAFVFVLLTHWAQNMLVATGNSGMPLIFSFAATALNIGLAFLFTGALKLGTMGVALATALSNITNFLLCFIYLLRKFQFLRKANIIKEFEPVGAIDLLKLGLPLGLQWSVLFIGSFYQAKKVNEFGNLATKAVSCYSPIEQYLTMPLSTFANALCSYVGQNYGAGKKDRIKKGLRDILILEVFLYAIVVTVGQLIAPYAAYIFMPRNEVEDPANGPMILYYTTTYIRIMSPFLILQGLLISFRSTLQGIKKPLIPFLSGLGELTTRILVCSFVPRIVNQENPLSKESFAGICFSNPSAWLTSALIMGIFVIYYLRDKKLNNLNPPKEEEKEKTEN